MVCGVCYVWSVCGGNHVRVKKGSLEISACILSQERTCSFAHLCLLAIPSGNLKSLLFRGEMFEIIF